MGTIEEGNRQLLESSRIMDFNQAQMTALEHRDGPMMVLAGRGPEKRQ